MTFSNLPIGSVVTVCPSEIRFSQKSCSETFSDGKTLASTLNSLKTHSVQPADIPMIQVVMKNDILYSVDNRRLVVFKQAEALGVCHTVKVRIVELTPYLNKRFTTDCGGVYIVVRGIGYIVGGAGGSLTLSDASKASGMVVAKAYFSKGAGRSRAPCLGVVLANNNSSNGTVSFKFHNMVEQVIPIGWIDEIICVVHEGDLVSAHFRGENNKKSQFPSVINALVKTIDVKQGKATIEFSNNAVQTVVGWWIVSSITLSIGDRVSSQCMFRNNLKLYHGGNFEGVVTNINELNDSGYNNYITVHFDSGAIQTFPLSLINKLICSGGWKKGLSLGTIVNAHFRIRDETELEGDTARSPGTCRGVVLANSYGHANIRFDDDTIQTDIPTGWIAELENVVSPGDFVTSHFKEKNDNSKSSGTYTGAVKSLLRNGDAVVVFTNEVKQTVPAYCITKSQALCIGDRVSCRFRTNKGKNNKFNGTIIRLPTTETMSVCFDNGVTNKKIPKHWMWKVLEASGWTSNVVPGSIVKSYFITDSKEKERSNNTCSGMVVSGSNDRGFCRVLFDNDTTQIVPCGWISSNPCFVSKGCLVDTFFYSDEVKQTHTIKAVVKHVNSHTGKVTVTFVNDVTQTIPGYFIQDSKIVSVGDRVDSHYWTKNFNKKVHSKIGDGYGTIVQAKKNSFSIRFDVNEAEQYIPRHWVKSVMSSKSSTTVSSSMVI